jgi:3-isopropylmalate/(R)-2-methylmalate dehydratase large subunit
MNINMIINKLKDFKKNKKITLNVDWFLIDDAISNTSVDRFIDGGVLCDKDKVIVAIDHDTPSGSEKAAIVQKKLINFAKDNSLSLYNGRGVGSVLLYEKHVKEGDVILSCEDDITVLGALGALGVKVSQDKFTEALETGVINLEGIEIKKIRLTGKLSGNAHSKDIILEIIKRYGTERFKNKIIELSGEALETLTQEDLMTICSLGKKTGAYSILINSQDDGDDIEHTLNLGEIKPLVVMPDSYDKIALAEELEKKEVNEVFLGGTAGGKIEDLRLAAKMLDGKKIAYKLRMIVAPVTSQTYIQALREGLIDIFLDAGCLVMNQGYSTDYGKSQGIVDTTEVLVSAGINNCKGNAGSKDASIYIVSPYLALVTAINGYLGGFYG